MAGPKSALTAVCSLFLFCWLLPAAAGAYATIAPPPKQSPSSELPDGRVYEQVTTANKHGYNAAVESHPSIFPLNYISIRFSIAAADGDALAYRSSGPVGNSVTSGLNENFVAERTNHGWISRASTARGLHQNESFGLFLQNANWADYTPDLSHMAYITLLPQLEEAPSKGNTNVYLLGPDPSEKPTWLLRSAAGPLLEGLGSPSDDALMGMTPNASVVYFAYESPLLPQDSNRSGWGIYESRHGVVSEIGLLPDGSVPSTGAYPAAAATNSPNTGGTYRIGENSVAAFDNQVSEDGTKVFYVISGQLYVHEIEPDGSERSVLVSASQVPGSTGEPAPHGASLFENSTMKYNGFSEYEHSGPTYAYASSDGSHVFFESVDQLTSEAPADGSLKVYDFNLDSGSLEYLPEVKLGAIVTAAKDGSSFVFVNGATPVPELDRWVAGPDGGQVGQIVQLPGGGFVGPARLVDHDSILVFQAQAPIAGFNDAGAEEIFRYDIPTNELTCVSCPPAGVKPSTNAYLSAVDQYGNASSTGFPFDRVVNDVRGVSSDGSRVFFASPDPLVSRDTNGTFDTYEWENGTVFLISSGTGSEYSPFLDNSESGGDVFFATSEELVPGDDDGSFDIYDARIPRPGDNPPPSAVPCSGDACQGPPSVAQLLGAPPSATFNGAGNVVEEPATPTKAYSQPKISTRSRELSAALRACRKHRIKSKRTACEKRERRRYSASGARIEHNGRRGK